MEEITEQSLDRLYDTFSREQLKHINSIKNSDKHTKINDIQKEINILNNLQMNILKLRNVRNKIKAKLDD